MTILAILILTFLSGLSLGVLIGDAAAWRQSQSRINRGIE